MVMPRVDDVLARAGVIARRLAGPIKVMGIVALAAGVGVWLMAALPAWEEGPSVAVGVFWLLLLAAPGLWLLLHHRWLERAFRKVEQMVPDATQMGRGAIDTINSEELQGFGKTTGRMRGAWTLYRRHLGPLRKQGTDIAQNAWGVTRPFMPWVLITTGVALALAVLLVVLVPLATLIRVVLQTT